MAVAATVELASLITSMPGVYGGRPCLSGTRFPVLSVASRYNGGQSAETIARDYDLPLEKVYAGIAYYLANRQSIDAELHEERLAYDQALAEHIAATQAK